MCCEYILTVKSQIENVGQNDDVQWSEQGAEKMTRLILLQLSSMKHFW